MILRRCRPSYELSERVMSDGLRELTDAGLVNRRVDPGPPIAATYRLTAHGARLQPVIEALRVWADEPSVEA